MCSTRMPFRNIEIYYTPFCACKYLGLRLQHVFRWCPAQSHLHHRRHTHAYKAFACQFMCILILVHCSLCPIYRDTFRHTSQILRTHSLHSTSRLFRHPLPTPFSWPSQLNSPLLAFWAMGYPAGISSRLSLPPHAHLHLHTAQAA